MSDRRDRDIDAEVGSNIDRNPKNGKISSPPRLVDRPLVERRGERLLSQPIVSHCGRCEAEDCLQCGPTIVDNMSPQV
jgi:hypothetical protein